MSASATQTQSETYSTADIEIVFRRFTTDLRMIAESSGAMTRSEAEDYGHDAEYLAKRKYVNYVDVTLFVNGEEEKAVRYTVTTSAGDLKPDRPGGVGQTLRCAPEYSLRSNKGILVLPKHSRCSENIVGS